MQKSASTSSTAAAAAQQKNSPTNDKAERKFSSHHQQHQHAASKQRAPFSVDAGGKALGSGLTRYGSKVKGASVVSASADNNTLSNVFTASDDAAAGVAHYHSDVTILRAAVVGGGVESHDMLNLKIKKHSQHVYMTELAQHEDEEDGVGILVGVGEEHPFADFQAAKALQHQKQTLSQSAHNQRLAALSAAVEPLSPEQIAEYSNAEYLISSPIMEEEEEEEEEEEAVEQEEEEEEEEMYNPKVRTGEGFGKALAVGGGAGFDPRARSKSKQGKGIGKSNDDAYIHSSPAQLKEQLQQQEQRRFSEPKLTAGSADLQLLLNAHINSAESPRYYIVFTIVFNYSIILTISSQIPSA